ncbi:MAG: restriction endonuclease [Candidatus Hodarchaeota archaeon]
MSFDLHTQPLSKLVNSFFEAMGFVSLHPALVFEHPLADSRLTHVLKRSDITAEENTGFIGVIVRDWKRIVGVGQIHKAEELLQACPNLEKILIISSMGFSYSATRLAERIGIGLLSRGELISFLLKRIEVL